MCKDLQRFVTISAAGFVNKCEDLQRHYKDLQQIEQIRKDLMRFAKIREDV